MKLKFSPPKFVPELYRAFPAAEVFLVGGMVRDLLLGRESKDIDLVIRGVPLPKLIKFLKKHGKVDVVGKLFGVIKFSVQKEAGREFSQRGLFERQRVPQPENLRTASFASAIDIAIPRTEISNNSGIYKDVITNSQFDLPIEADLSRRDFTINAIALNLKTNELVDPFGGQIDLQKKILRAVGNPNHRFQEDYTRVLRGLRFACQLNFAIDPTTWRAIKKFTAHLNETFSTEKNSEPQRKVPHELIGREFMKSLCADPVRFMDLWDKSGAFAATAPEILKMHKCPQPRNYHTEGDVWQHTVLALRNLHGAPYKKFARALPKIYSNETAAGSTALIPASPTQYLATLLHDVAKPTTIQTPKKDKVDRIRFTNHDILGGQLTRVIAERLRLSSVEGLNVDIDLAVWLVDHHLLAVQADVADMKATTIEKYFLRDVARGRELLIMLFADGSATLPKNKKDAERHVDDVLKRVRQLLRASGRAGQKQTLAKPLITGHDILRAFKLLPGPEIGQMLQFAREAQLSGRAKNKNELLKLLRAAYKNNF